MKNLKKLLKHLFVPHRGNAYRPHAFRHKALSVYSIGLILSQVFLGVTTYSGPVLMAGDVKTLSTNIIVYTNKEREAAGLSALAENQALSNAANLKLQNMFQLNYWDHTGPNGETAWQFIEQADYSYALAGENLARGFATSQDTVGAWMASPSHRENILNAKFQEIGVAVGSGKIGGNMTTVIVQLFGQPRTAYATANPPTVLASQKILPEVSLGNATLPSKIPYLMVWLFIFGFIVIDGVMIRKLGLHCSKSHMFNFRASLLMSSLAFIMLTIGFVAIA